MEQIAISKFKGTCLAVLERVRRTRKPVLITRFGVPVAQVVPPPPQPRPKGVSRLDAGHRPDSRRHHLPSHGRGRVGGAAFMKLLLDTHIWLWSFLEPGRLAPRVANALESSENELWLSPLSTWETLVLSAKRRVKLEPEPVTWISRALTAVPLKEAPLTHEVALETRKVHLPDRDPVDQLLAATARVFELTLVTADERLIRAKGLPTLANR